MDLVAQDARTPGPAPLWTTIVMTPTNDIALTHPALGSYCDGGSSRVRGIRMC